MPRKARLGDRRHHREALIAKADEPHMHTAWSKADHRQLSPGVGLVGLERVSQLDEAPECRLALFTAEFDRAHSNGVDVVIDHCLDHGVRVRAKVDRPCRVMRRSRCWVGDQPAITVAQGHRGVHPLCPGPDSTVMDEDQVDTPGADTSARKSAIMRSLNWVIAPYSSL
ncbi:MAG: hypothetical protein AUG49_14210 [Catenulispora sp. 13_1_20CM_3_70_7]|jgi:hypothetical protein|nr:MAG: hypothetical protein AUG49_14210 [Catenulispora sp. 13_1_20CM_3_70_7]